MPRAAPDKQGDRMKRLGLLLLAFALSSCTKSPEWLGRCWPTLKATEGLHHRHFLAHFSTMGRAHIVSPLCKHYILGVRYEKDFKDFSGMDLTRFEGGVSKMVEIDLDGRVEKDAIGDGYSIVIDKILDAKRRPDLKFEDFL